MSSASWSVAGVELDREFVLLDDQLGIDAGIAGPADDLDDPAFRRSAAHGIGDDLGGHDVAVFGLAGVLPADDQVLGDLGVLGRYKSVSAGLRIGKLIGADDPGVRALEDADDHALALACDLLSADRRRYAGHDLVAVHGVQLALRGDIDVGLAFFLRQHEPEALGMGLEDAGFEVHLLGQAVAVAARLDDLAGQDELVQRPFELMPVIGRELQQPHQFAHHHGLAGPGLDQIDELFVGVVHK